MDLNTSLQVDNDSQENNTVTDDVDSQENNTSMDSVVTENHHELKRQLDQEYKYPNEDDVEFQNKLYKKREYHIYKSKKRNKIITYDEIKSLRDSICAPPTFALQSHQSLIRNFLNPWTPYRGLLVFHGTGTGKTCLGTAVAENFIEQVKRYGTKIHILVPGTHIKSTWKKEIVFCTGKKYFNNTETVYNDAEKDRILKNAMYQTKQFYEIMSFKTFNKKVLGEKVKQLNQSKKQKKNEVIRDIAINKIDNLNNTLLIIDESHQVGAGNGWGKSVMKIIKNSVNLKVLLLTATPMQNKADDIVELLNFVRPPNDPIERDRVFVTNRNITDIEFKPDGQQYLERMASGYVSHLRGADPLTFAKRVNKGTKPGPFLFTPIIRCRMLKFQKELYDSETKQSIKDDDTLMRKLQSAANMILPGLDNTKTSIIGHYGSDGLDKLTNQIKYSHKELTNLINKELLGGKYPTPLKLMYLNSSKKITGHIFKENLLKLFSIKFYKALKKINRVVEGEKGMGTVFVNSNLVQMGVDLFQEVLIQNGYLEYNEEQQYNIVDTTRCYYCGKLHHQHDAATHEFAPATFMVLTGQNTEGDDVLPEQKHEVIDKVFNSVENKYGKNIKIILGSKVMHEGVTLHNVKQVHILDFFWNLGRIEQTIGRAIRHCRHYDVMTEAQPFPQVTVYKYCVSNKSDLLTPEEDSYRKAELKYVMIKKVERLLKTVAIDCPLNHNSNVFPEEVEMYKGCKDKGPYKCPQVCDFTDCHFTCNGKKLNLEYYDKDSQLYKNIDKKKLDYTTFTDNLSRSEIDYVKIKIKELYRVKHIYTLDEILQGVKESFTEDNREFFDDFFVFRGLDELLPITENDHNNFTDTILDNNNRSGYLIFRSNHYIFQPFDAPENITMRYRMKGKEHFHKDLSLRSHMDHYNIKSKTQDVKKVIKTKKYDFSNVEYYYFPRKDNTHVGIIDTHGNKEQFKLRMALKKNEKKKRGTGIQSITGAVCNNSNSLSTLRSIASQVFQSKKVIKPSLDRNQLCELIKNKLLYNEKYLNDNVNYLIVPFNHPMYYFPVNIKDRSELFVKEITKFTNDMNVKIKTKKSLTGRFMKTSNNPCFTITIDIAKVPADQHRTIVDYVESIVRDIITVDKTTITILVE